MKRTLLVTLTALTSLAIAVGIGFLALKATGNASSRGLWILRQRIFGLEEVGIWQDDPRLGWRHLPGSEGRHRDVPDFDVRYRIDTHGHRASPASYALPKVLVLGGSFTFGHGVEDSETYPARLEAALPGYKVINGAVNAWGTTQALLKLEESLKRYDDIQLVVYGFIAHHHRRNYLRRSWLEHIYTTRKRRNPYFSLAGDRPVYRGLADPRKDALPDGPEIEQSEARITVALLEEMRARCSERRVPFLVAFLPDGSARSHGAWLETAIGPEHFLDLRPLDPFQRHRFTYDLHPNAKGHLVAAEGLAPRLRDLLQTSGTAAPSGESPIE